MHVRLRSSVMQREDPEGKVGVKIGKELMQTASDALKANVTRLAPLVLPVSEQLIFAGNLFARKARPQLAVTPLGSLSFCHTHCTDGRPSQVNSDRLRVENELWHADVASLFRFMVGSRCCHLQNLG
jgi:3-ketoacyl-CoA synthase